MELMEDLDPRKARAIIDPALKLMIEAVAPYEGYSWQFDRDGIFALFGREIAHEDHPQRALYAALRLQEELKTLIRTACARKADCPAAGTVGVNTGEVVVRSIQTGEGAYRVTPIGHTANLAARMQILAPIGSIAATEQVRKLCEGYFLFNGLGPTKVKGVSEPVNVYEVTGLGPLRTRLQRGVLTSRRREREMGTLKHAAEQAKDGVGRSLAVIGRAWWAASHVCSSSSRRPPPRAGWCWRLFDFTRQGVSVSAVNRLCCVTISGSRTRTMNERGAKKGQWESSHFGIVRSKTPSRICSACLSIVEGDDPLAQMDGQNSRSGGRSKRSKAILLRESLNHAADVIFEDLHWIDSETRSS